MPRTARRLLVSSRLATTLLATALGAMGCASGGGEDDAGGSGGFDAGPLDSGPIAVDAGPLPTDAGPVETDGGPLPSDGGPLPNDAGPIGSDAGPIPVDAGPIPVDAGPLPTDAGPACTGSPCRVRPTQCGCGPGQGCYPITGSRMCMTAGTTAETGACSAHTECQAGLLCVAGQCTRVCTDDADCTGRGSLCQFTTNVGGENFNVCSVPCEPATAAGCLAGNACRHFNAGGGRGFYTDCVAAGSTPAGSVCNTNSQCTANHTCVQVNPFGDANCHRICNVNSPPSGCFICSEYVDQDPNIEGDPYGFCF